MEERPSSVCTLLHHPSIFIPAASLWHPPGHPPPHPLQAHVQKIAPPFISHLFHTFGLLINPLTTLISTLLSGNCPSPPTVIQFPLPRFLPRGDAVTAICSALVCHRPANGDPSVITLDLNYGLEPAEVREHRLGYVKSSAGLQQIPDTQEGSHLPPGLGTLWGCFFLQRSVLIPDLGI